MTFFSVFFSISSFFLKNWLVIASILAYDSVVSLETHLICLSGTVFCTLLISVSPQALNALIWGMLFFPSYAFEIAVAVVSFN